MNVKIGQILVILTVMGIACLGWKGIKPVIAASKTGRGGTEMEIVSPTASPSATPAPSKSPARRIIVPEARGGELEDLVRSQDLGRWNGVNSGKWAVRTAVDRGVSANTIALMLLLPLIATMVAVLHYVIGLTGYGIFTPTMIAVTFLATGIPGGLTLFALILAISIIGGNLIKRFKLHFWPARSINLVLISLGTFGLMLGSSYFRLIDIRSISIFPILFMILLAEDFVRTQLVKSPEEAKKLTIGTLILAMTAAFLMQIRWIQERVLLNPELVIMAVVLVNLWVGNYNGMRWLEVKRFKRAIRKKGTKIWKTDSKN